MEEANGLSATKFMASFDEDGHYKEVEIIKWQ